MHAHIIEPPRQRTETTGADVTGVVTPVGTFASGQSTLGSFRVAAEAEVGSYASGLTADQPPEKV
jgi:hypothetical protein